MFKSIFASLSLVLFSALACAQQVSYTVHDGAVTSSKTVDLETGVQVESQCLSHTDESANVQMTCVSKTSRLSPQEARMFNESLLKPSSYEERSNAEIGRAHV